MNVSLFRSISDQFKDMRGINTVSMMNTISHLVEDQIINHQLPVNLYVGFERFSYFPSQLRRYSHLGAASRRVYVFGVPDVRPPSIPGIEFIPIAPTSPLAREWFVLVDTPDFWTALLTQEVEGRDVITGGRRFDGIWSFDEQVVERVSLLMSQMMEVPFTPVGKRNPERQSRHIAEISDQLAASLDGSKLANQRRWRQICVLQKFSELSIQNKPIHVLLHDAAQVLHTIFGADDVAITISDDSEQYQIIGAAGSISPSKQPLRLENGPSATATTQGRLVQVNDVRQPRERDASIPMARSLIAAPLLGRSRVQGALVLGSATPDKWTEDDGQTMMACANMLFSMVERSRLQQILFGVTYQQNAAH